MKKLIFETHSTSAEETFLAGGKLGSYIEENLGGLAYSGVVFVAMYGDLGVGKTCFVSGMADVLCPGSEVCSPTYSLVNEYEGKIKLVHCDMYRVTSEDDLESTGFFDCKNCVIAAEWCENAPFAVPLKHISVTIEKTGSENERNVRVFFEDGEKAK